MVTCRFTHVYPDGAGAVLHRARAGAPRRRSSSSGRRSRRAASEAMLAAGGTITHHHAVGRDHRPWYDRQRPELFAAALRAAKAAAGPRRHPQPRRAGGSAAIALTSRSMSDSAQARPRARRPRPARRLAPAAAAALAGRAARERVGDRRGQRRGAGRHRAWASRARWRSSSARSTRPGLRLEHVRLLVCTHAHSDHYGLAGPIVDAAGCELWMHPNHAHMTRAAEDPERRSSAASRWRARAACPAEALAPLPGGARGPGRRRRRASSSPTATWCPGVEVETDLGRWQVYETPGTRRRTSACTSPTAACCISGDHLLGRVSLYYDYGYTPDPAGEFLQSWTWWTALDASLCLAGHGAPVPRREGAHRGQPARGAPSGSGGCARRSRSGAATPFEIVPTLLGESTSSR